MNKWTRTQEIALINKTQDEYVQELSDIVFAPINKDDADSVMKFVSLNAPTGTGKTQMMAKFINAHPECFFLVTTLSRGQLNQQVEASLRRNCAGTNFKVFGLMQLTTKTHLQPKDIESLIDGIPQDKKLIWFRDEGHIRTNNWSSILEDRCFKIINMSATNRDATINCNFIHTMMLRTVEQQLGSVNAALNKLCEIKRAHQNVPKYNPCALFRVVSEGMEESIITLCKQRGLKCITLIDNQNYNMQALCEDDNEYDVIINKMKIVEGVDIRRAHVIWIEKRPKNLVTLVQQVGRALRNALLWRNDIDILAPENKQLLKDTRKAYVFYHATKNDDVDLDDELLIAFCPHISIQRLKPNMTVFVEDGELSNGLEVMELRGKTGYYNITIDTDTGFNVVDCPDVYEERRNYPVNPQLSQKIEQLNTWLQKQSPKFFDNLQQTLQKYYNDGRWVTNEWIPGQYKPNSIPPIIQEDGLPKIKECNCAMYNSPPTELNRRKQRVVEMIPCYEITLHFASNKIKLTGDELMQIAQNKIVDASCLHSDRFASKDVRSVITNNRLIAILGIDYCRPAGESGKLGWTEERAITSKITRFSKLNEYITARFAEELSDAATQCFTGENHFDFSPRLNSCLGQCIEDCAKYIAYGAQYLNLELKQVAKECKNGKKSIPLDVQITRACLLKQHNRAKACGLPHHGFSASLQTLMHPEYRKFANTVYTYGTQAAQFLSNVLDVQKAAKTCHELNTEHIIGVMDACDGETIVDIKVTGHINLSMIKQVLAYYVLSPTIPGMNIKRVIVYDVTTNRSVTIRLPPQPTWSSNTKCLARRTPKPAPLDARNANKSFQQAADAISHYLLKLSDDTMHKEMNDVSLNEAKKRYGYSDKGLKAYQKATSAYDVYADVCIARDNRFKCTKEGVQKLFNKAILHIKGKWNPFFFDFVSEPSQDNSYSHQGINKAHYQIAAYLRPLVDKQFPELQHQRLSNLEHLRCNFEQYRLVFDGVKHHDPLLRLVDTLSIQDNDHIAISRFLTEDDIKLLQSQSQVEFVNISQNSSNRNVLTHKIYTVARGRNPGIYLSWDACKKEVHKYPGAIYKSFFDIQSAETYYAQFNGGKLPCNAEYLRLKHLMS